MWESPAEKHFIVDRSKANTHTQRNVRVSSLRRSVLKRHLDHLQRTVFLGLCFHLVSHLASFPLSDWTQGPPWYAYTSFSQGGLQQDGLWEIDSTYYGMVSPPILFFFSFFLFYFIFKIYNIVLVLPNIKMNPPQVYLCSASWTVLPPPSPNPPSGSSQCTSPKHPVLCIEPGLVTRFIHGIIHVSMPFSQISPPSPSPTESIRLFYT